MKIQRHCGPRMGMTLIELSISTILLVGLSMSLIGALGELRSTTDSGSLQAQQIDEARHALSTITIDLRRSGFTTIGASNYPYLFDDGDADVDPNFAVHEHVPATQDAVPGDVDFGVMREIVFVQPMMATDAQGDEVAQIDGAGVLMFGAAEISYVVSTGVDGVNYLERRVDGANPRRIASHVERIVFDDTTTSGGTVPNGSIRVQVFFRSIDVDGTLLQSNQQITVRLRNG